LTNNTGYAIAIDSFGNTLTAGLFTGTVDFDPGPGTFNLTASVSPQEDIYISKVDANQNLVWAKHIGSVDFEWPYSIHTDAGGFVYLYGHFSGTVDFDPGPGVYNMATANANDYNIFICKLSPAGNFVWAIQMTGNSDSWGMCMDMDENGFIYASGYVYGVTDMDPGPATVTVGANSNCSVFAAKYDTSGTLLWAKSMDGVWNNWAYSIHADRNGFVYITGMVQGPIDFDPGPATFTVTGTGGGSIFVCKLDPLGNFVWVKTMGGSGQTADVGHCVEADDNGNVYFTGKFADVVDFDPGAGVTNLTSNSPSLHDAFLAKLDVSGNLLWAFPIGGSQIDEGYSLSIDSTGYIILTGALQSDSADFDPSPSSTYMLVSSGNTAKFFLARFAPSSSFECGFLIEYCVAGKIMLSQHLAVKGLKAYLTGGFLNTVDFNPCPAIYNLTAMQSGSDAFIAGYDFSTCSCSMQPTVASSNLLCYGVCTGSASIVVQGGVPPYSYSWSPNPDTGNTAINLCAGSYTCVVTDALGATVSHTYAITQPTALSTSISGSSILCVNSCTGFAQVSASGGTPGYTYAWSNTQNTSGINSLCPGTYSVIVSDVNGCSDSLSISINQSPTIVATISATATPCNSSNGSVAVSASGGAGTLSYLWIPGSYTTSVVSNLAAGIYTVTVTDQNGCTAVLTDTVVAVGAPVTFTSGIVNNACSADSSGTATVHTSGAGPFSYQWSPYGGSDSTAINLTAGTYSVIVTDVQGCTQLQTVVVTAPPLLTGTLSVTNDNCSTSSGAISISASGGVNPYSYVWSNSQTTSSINGLPAGVYSVTVTDLNGCTYDTSVVVSATVAPTLNITSLSNALCFGDSTGMATINASGGSAPLSYAWQPYGGNNSNATGLAAGTYTVTVTGSDGCSSSVSITVSQPQALVLNCSAVAENCSNADGSASAVAGGGSGGYTFLWNTLANTDSIQQLASGIYSVVVTDMNGCFDSCSVMVPTTATAMADAGQDVTIEEGQSVLLTATGGLTYLWTPADLVTCNNCASTIATPSVTTVFIVTVIDSAGCTDYDTVTVTVEIPCDDIFVPNAFSPNGDSQNDVLFLRGTCIATFSFLIYNRWGELVFSTNDQMVGWDGRHRGELCESAVFNYVVSGTKTDGSLFSKSGNITLVR
jgi:gliding motility-associated-like protein